MRQFLANSLFGIAVRARKSPWIETRIYWMLYIRIASGLVRARGLKLTDVTIPWPKDVRARKSPWIETVYDFHDE